MLGIRFIRIIIIKKLASEEPSQFTYSISNILERDKLLVELGCRNERDSILFAEQRIWVKVIDQSEATIKTLEVYGHRNIYFYNEHYRRFIIFEGLIGSMKKWIYNY